MASVLLIEKVVLYFFSWRLHFGASSDRFDDPACYFTMVRIEGLTIRILYSYSIAIENSCQCSEYALEFAPKIMRRVKGSGTMNAATYVRHSNGVNTRCEFRTPLTLPCHLFHPKHNCLTGLPTIGR
jgi:hypothetical protein